MEKRGYFAGGHRSAERPRQSLIESTLLLLTDFGEWIEEIDIDGKERHTHTHAEGERRREREE
jgi:hypothetical protein